MVKVSILNPRMRRWLMLEPHHRAEEDVESRSGDSLDVCS
jgi:hypothetical protein